MYRAPNQRTDDFVTANNELLDKISRENKVCFLMGDFSVNLMNYHHHHLTGQFLDRMYSTMFFSFDYTSIANYLPHHYVN